MKSDIKKNLLIFIRHGERSDRIPGLTPTFNKNDPELTLNGKRQAYDIGLILSDYLFDNYPTFNNINIISSPFARTIQTSKNILKGLSNKFSIDDCLNIDYYFAEYIKDEFPTHDYPTFLVVKNDINKLLPDLENTNLNYVNDPDNIISKKYEDDELCKSRISRGLENLWMNFENQKNKENNVLIIISHGDPINFANIELGYPGPFNWRNIKYCNSFIYEIDFIEDESGIIKRDVRYIDQLIPEQNI